jgi:hypothetical protein
MKLSQNHHQWKQIEQFIISAFHIYKTKQNKKKVYFVKDEKNETIQ